MKKLSALAAVAVVSLSLAACSDDDDSDDATTTTAEDGAAAGDTVTLTAVDYAYTGVPNSVAAGTTLVLQNDSEGEVHEILAFLIPADEERSVADLVALPPEEQEAIFGAAEPIVALAPPGAPSTATPAPPAVLAEAGRYALLCFIPTGAPPDEVMAAVAAYIEAGDEAGDTPDYPDTGPPHVANGMFAELVVT